MEGQGDPVCEVVSGLQVIPVPCPDCASLTLTVGENKDLIQCPVCHHEFTLADVYILMDSIYGKKIAALTRIHHEALQAEVRDLQKQKTDLAEDIADATKSPS